MEVVVEVCPGEEASKDAQVDHLSKWNGEVSRSRFKDSVSAQQSRAGDGGNEVKKRVETGGGKHPQELRKTVGGGDSSRNAVWFRDGGTGEKTGGGARGGARGGRDEG